MAASHALITRGLRGRRPRRAAQRPLRRHLPARRQGAHALGPDATTSSTRPTSTPSPPRVRDETRLIWVETPTNPPLNVVDVAGVVARRGRRARRRRQHVRHAGQPAPARARRRLRRALDDEVPRRPLRRGRRRGRSRATPSCTSSCASCRTRSARCPGRSTASSSTAGCARCTCGWRARRERARPSSAFLRGGRGRRGRPLARLRRHGLLPPPGRDPRSRRRRGSSRSPSRSAASSR